jgi:hypothetical protein
MFLRYVGAQPELLQIVGKPDPDRNLEALDELDGEPDEWRRYEADGDEDDDEERGSDEDDGENEERFTSCWLAGSVGNRAGRRLTIRAPELDEPELITRRRRRSIRLSTPNRSVHTPVTKVW